MKGHHRGGPRRVRRNHTRRPPGRQGNQIADCPPDKARLTNRIADTSRLRLPVAFRSPVARYLPRPANSRSSFSSSGSVYSGDMGNTFGLKRILDRLEPALLVVEVPQIVIHKADQPDPVARLAHADVLARKHRIHVDLPALPTNPPAAGDGRRPVRAAGSPPRATRGTAGATGYRPRRAPSSRGPGGAAPG